MIRKFIPLLIILFLIVLGLLVYQKANLDKISLISPKISSNASPPSSAPEPQPSPTVTIDDKTDLQSLNNQFSPEDFAGDFEKLKEEVKNF